MVLTLRAQPRQPLLARSAVAAATTTKRAAAGQAGTAATA